MYFYHIVLSWKSAILLALEKYCLCNSSFGQLSDFHKYAANGVLKENVKLERAVFLFNNITHWVQCMVLDHHKPSERAQAIVKFVEVAKVRSALHGGNARLTCLRKTAN